MIFLIPCSTICTHHPAFPPFPIIVPSKIYSIYLIFNPQEKHAQTPVELISDSLITYTPQLRNTAILIPRTSPFSLFIIFYFYLFYAMLPFRLPPPFLVPVVYHMENDSFLPYLPSPSRRRWERGGEGVWCKNHQLQSPWLFYFGQSLSVNISLDKDF